jgi:Flp pilus assembly protein TadD
MRVDHPRAFAAGFFALWYREAFPLVRRALRIAEAKLGPAAPWVATILHDMGGLEHERGRYAKAEPLARHSVEIRRAALGPRHPDVAAAEAAYAAILDELGRRSEAERPHRAPGPTHPLVRNARENLAASVCRAA